MTALWFGATGWKRSARTQRHRVGWVAVVCALALLATPLHARVMTKRLPYHWVDAAAPLTIVYVPAVEEIYLEIERDGSRYARFQLVGADPLVSAVSRDGVGSWTERSLAGAAVGHASHFGPAGVAAKRFFAKSQRNGSAGRGRCASAPVSAGAQR